jgi:hypothetical protein
VTHLTTTDSNFFVVYSHNIIFHQKIIINYNGQARPPSLTVRCSTFKLPMLAITLSWNHFICQYNSTCKCFR